MFCMGYRLSKHRTTGYSEKSEKGVNKTKGAIGERNNTKGAKTLNH